MDILTIIEIIGSVLGGLGLFEFLKWLFTRKEEKKSMQLDNTQKEQDIESKKTDDTIDKWERLSAQHEKDLEYYRSLVQDRDQIIAEKDARLDQKDIEIADLKEQLDKTRSELVRAQLLRCSVISCPERKPPLGYVEAPIEEMYNEQ